MCAASRTGHDVLTIATALPCLQVWARFVLGIVPQTDADAAALGLDVSLASAATKGQIATIPLSQVIQAKYPQYSWVQRTASAFITLSITVSFNALGLGLKHVSLGAHCALVVGAALLASAPSRFVC